MNMADTIAPKSLQLNSDDLIAGPRTIKITRVTANEGSAEQPVNVYFEGDNDKPFRPCKTIRRVMVSIWGTDAAAYVGRSMTIYRDPEVVFGGMKVGGIRISHMSDMAGPMTLALTATRATRKPYTVKPLAVEPAKPAAPQVTDAILSIAMRAAGRGTQAFRDWCRANPEWRDFSPGTMADLKAKCAEVDLAMEQDPFGLPPVADTPIPTPAEVDAKMAEVAREFAEGGTE
jgi:hypothetical protein